MEEDGSPKWNSNERRINSLLLLSIHFIPRNIVDIIELKVEKMQSCVYPLGVCISSYFTRKTLTCLLISECFFAFFIIQSDKYSYLVQHCSPSTLFN